MHPIEPQESWDKKKIFVFFLIVLPLAFFSFKIFVLDKNIDLFYQKPKAEFEQIKGVSSVANLKPIDIQETVEQKINSLKTEVNNINVVDIATSSPAVQKVLNDIKNLQNLPKNQCLNICNSICVR